MLATGPDDSVDAGVELMTGVTGVAGVAAIGTSTTASEAGASISSSYW